MSSDPAGVTTPIPFPTANQPMCYGLLITTDQALVRAFRRELKSCIDVKQQPFDVQATIERAPVISSGPYQWVGVDLDGSMGPADAVNLARSLWPDTRIAAISHFWSERDVIARELADIVIHKPPRAQELRQLVHPVVTNTSAAPPSVLASGG